MVILVHPEDVLEGMLLVSDAKYAVIPLRLSLAEIERLTTVFVVLESPELMVNEVIEGAVLS